MIHLKRKLPSNLDAPERELFTPHLEHAVPEPSVKRYTNVRASDLGLLVRGTRLLPEAFPDTLESDEWSWESNRYNRPATRWKHVIKSYIPGRTLVLKEPCVWFTDTWSLSYYFWLTETLARLELLRDRIDDGCPVVMPGYYTEVDFVKTTLDLFGIKNIHPVPPRKNLLLREVYIPQRTAGIHHYNPELVCSVGERFRSTAPPNLSHIGNKLHISRRKARMRKFINNDEVDAVFDRFGYTTVCMEDYSFREQVGMLTQASVLASIHGAGLTNMLMMKPGSRVFEMRMRGDFNSSFFNLASACEHTYYYQTCEPETPGVHEQQNNFIADIDLLTRNLELIENDQTHT